jgi:hypothetical protein
MQFLVVRRLGSPEPNRKIASPLGAPLLNQQPPSCIFEWTEAPLTSNRPETNASPSNREKIVDNIGLQSLDYASAIQLHL